MQMILSLNIKCQTKLFGKVALITKPKFLYGISYNWRASFQKMDTTLCNNFTTWNKIKYV